MPAEAIAVVATRNWNGSLRRLLLLVLLLGPAAQVWAADAVTHPLPLTNDKWMPRSVCVENGTMQAEVMRMVVGCIHRDAGQVPVKVIAVRLPQTNILWYGIFRFYFDTPQLVQINGTLWAIEPDGVPAGIRITRLRKHAFAQRPDDAATKVIVQKTFEKYDIADTHMELGLPVIQLLAEKFRFGLGKQPIPREDPIKLSTIVFKENRIIVEGVHLFVPITLVFAHDWKLEELRQFGRPEEFNHEEASRAYTIWKKALDREIEETEK